MKDKYSTIHYHQYLQLDKILNAQEMRSLEVGEKPAHEEMLFIIVHQVYELWFKQSLHEVGSICKLFKEDQIDERSLGLVNGRLERVAKILKLMTEQISIMETMTPLDFLDFRNYLFPASGFQSIQFRLFENAMGLPADKRITYNSKKYDDDFPEYQKKMLDDVYKNGTLFDLVEKWLERTPFLQFKGFDFLPNYKVAIDNMIRKEVKGIEESEYLTDEEKKNRKKMHESANLYFNSVFDKKAHDKLRADGVMRFSYEATLAALFINLYRDEPILHMPFKLLINLMELDELLTTWRYRHAQMVLRMLGKKIGTGGSSGYDYLISTALKHQIFIDLHNISTLLIPRSELPDLPQSLKDELNFHYSVSK